MNTVLPQIPKEFFEEIISFREIMMMYHSAIREVTTRLEILNDELSLDNNNSPIQFIKSRVKEPLSIVSKLNRIDKDISVVSILNNLNDVAGIRVISPFIDDVYSVVDMLLKQDDIILIEKKDYIKHPKSNGYRSFHLIVEVPVFFSEEKHSVRVEIQIRTVAMDFWASLEHQLKYKNNLENSSDIEKQLKQCAETISQTDIEMMEIRNNIEKSQ